MPDKKTKLAPVADAQWVQDENPQTTSSVTKPVADAQWVSDDAPSSINTSDLLSKIATKESGGDYTATNPNSTATGKYQFLWGTKSGEGFGDSIKKVTGVKSQEEFLNSPEAQEKFAQYHADNNLIPAAARLSTYNKQGYSDSQLARLAHFKGEEGAKQYLQSGVDNTRRHNSSIEDYVGEPENANPTPVQEVNNTIPSSIAAPQQQQAQGLTAQDPITNLPKEEPVNEKQQVADKTSNAVQVISKDILDNFDNHHPQDQQNMATIPFHEPGNLLHDITNPHGNTDLTSNSLKDALARLQQQRSQEINDAQGFNDDGLVKKSGANPQDINKAYDQKEQELKESYSDILKHQQFNRDYTDKKYTQEESTDLKHSAEMQRLADIKKADENLKNKFNTEDKSAVEINKEYSTEVGDINRSYSQKMADINNATKYDDVRLGLEHAKLLGDPQAQIDYDRYNAGKSLSPESKLKYQLQGQDVIKTGTLSTTNKNVAKEGQAHIKDGAQIEKENQELFNERRRQHIGEAIVNDVNPIYESVAGALPGFGAIQSLYNNVVPKLGSISEEEMKSKGKKLGYTDEQLDKLNPKDIPTRATIWSSLGKGALNSAAPIYEQGIRMAGRIAGANPDDVNEAFPAGWENQRGPGAALVGNSVPSTTNGILGQVMEGIGGLAMLPAEIGGLAKVAGAFTKTEQGAHALANFGVMAFNGYNNAYHESSEIIGDKPSDEWKRQLYAATMGSIEGAIFSMAPGGGPGGLAERAIGVNGAEKGGSLVGKDFLKEMADAKDLSFIQSPSGVKKLTQVVMESAKDNGIQIGLASASEIAKSTINTVLNPKKQTNLPEDLKNTAITTALTMALPSILAGLNHVSMQTPMAKGAMFDIGSHPEKYTQEIQKQQADSTITPEQANQYHSAIATMKSVVDNQPVVDIKGQPLTPDQIKDYAWNRLRQHALEAQADQINEQATQSNIAPDKAQLAPINEQIAELEGERTKILSGKGAKRTPFPVSEQAKEVPKETRADIDKDLFIKHDISSNPEQSIDEALGRLHSHLADELKLSEKEQLDRVYYEDNIKELQGFKDRYAALEKAEETPVAERSVATKDEEKTSGEKKENISPSEKEKDISLQPQIVINEKKIDHGNSNEENNGRKSNPIAEESEGSRKGTELREAAHSNGGNEQEENRELSKGEVPEGNRELQGELSPSAAIPVSKTKEKKNRFAKIEEKTPVVAEEAKLEETQSQTEPHATIHSEEQKQEIPEQGGQQEHAPVEPARGETEAAKPESSDSHISGKTEEEVAEKENVPRETEPTTPVSEAESAQEKPTEEPTPARSVANQADKAPEADQQKSPLSSAIDNFNKYKDAAIKKEAALQKLHDEGKRKGDEAYDKKVAELDQAKNKKLEAFKEYEKQFRKEQSPNNKSLSKTIREKTNKLADKVEKKQIKGAKAGFGPSDADLVKFIGNRVADLVELGENIHLAIRKALDEFRGKLTKDQETEFKTHFEKGPEIRNYIDNLRDEPPMLHSKEDYDLSIGLSKDIRRGNDTFPEVMDDLHDANISPERKKAIADFITWQVGDKHIIAEKENQEKARNSDNPLDTAKFKDDSILAEYLGIKTTKNIFGEEGLFDNEDEKKVRIVLENIMGDVHNFINLYKTDPDVPISEWGRRMLDDTKKVGDPEKQVAAASGLGIELQSERIKNEKGIEDINKQIASAAGDAKEQLVTKRGELVGEGNKIKGLLKEMQNFKKKLLSKASATMNVGRLDRLLRNEMLFEHYEKAILSDKERAQKAEMEKALHKSIIDDYKNHPEYIKERKLEDEAAASKKRAMKEAEKKNPTKETVAEKAKKIARIIKKSIEGKKIYKEGKEAAERDFGLNEKGEKMTAKDFLEHLKKLKNPC